MLGSYQDASLPRQLSLHTALHLRTKQSHTEPFDTSRLAWCLMKPSYLAGFLRLQHMRPASLSATPLRGFVCCFLALLHARCAQLHAAEVERASDGLMSPQQPALLYLENELTSW